MTERVGGRGRERDTETQRHRDTETQRHRDTETQRHRDTETQRYRDTERRRCWPSLQKKDKNIHSMHPFVWSKIKDMRCLGFRDESLEKPLEASRRPVMSGLETKNAKRLYLCTCAWDKLVPFRYLNIFSTSPRTCYPITFSAISIEQCTYVYHRVCLQTIQYILGTVENWLICID
jgi:hypothetical protein